jgi:hypothetical protein
MGSARSHNRDSMFRIAIEWACRRVHADGKRALWPSSVDAWERVHPEILETNRGFE